MTTPSKRSKDCPEGYELLYSMPRKTWVVTPEGHEFFFDHIDGMYSYCKDKDGNIVHYAAWTPVKPIDNPTSKSVLKRKEVQTK